MNNLPINEGKRMQELIKRSALSKKDIWQGMGLSSYSNLERYLKQEKIKPEIIKKFCKVIDITVEQFYTDEPAGSKTNKKDHAKGKHLGNEMRKAIERSGINITTVVKELNVSRATLYNWFKQADIDQSVLLHVAEILKIPVAELKGIGIGPRSFEKDIYLLLAAIDQKIDKLLAAD